MSSWHGALPYFSERELRCKGSGIIRLDLRFAVELCVLRQAWEKPLAPSSCCRSPAHNAKVGGHWRSSHLTENPEHPGSHGTFGIDIAWAHWGVEEQEAFYRFARDRGWACGLNRSFIHLDLRRMLGMPVVTFQYDAWDHRFPHYLPS